MTPYAAWIQSKAEMPTSIDSEEGPFIAGEWEGLFRDELCGLTEMIIENLMTSSAAQLRKSFVSMEQQLEERRRESQKSYFLGEISKIEERTTALVAEALVPVLSELQRNRIINEFALLLKKTLPEFAEQSLTISAPNDVHTRLSNALEMQSIEADLATSNDGQLAVSGSSVVLRADLHQWARSLSEVATV